MTPLLIGDEPAASSLKLGSSTPARSSRQEVVVGSRPDDVGRPGDLRVIDRTFDRGRRQRGVAANRIPSVAVLIDPVARDVEGARVNCRIGVVAVAAVTGEPVTIQVEIARRGAQRDDKVDSRPGVGDRAGAGF